MVGEDEVHESMALARALRQAGDLDVQGAAAQLGWSLEASSRAADFYIEARRLATDSVAAMMNDAFPNGKKILPTASSHCSCSRPATTRTR